MQANTTKLLLSYSFTLTYYHKGFPLELTNNYHDYNLCASLLMKGINMMLSNSLLFLLA